LKRCAKQYAGLKDCMPRGGQKLHTLYPTYKTEYEKQNTGNYNCSVIDFDIIHGGSELFVCRIIISGFSI
jgi:hypothetical protein